MSLTLSCALATSRDSHEHARIAESLGYTRAYFYDSPALYPDVYVQMCRAAERTTSIVIGTGVAVPHLRHPMTTAAAIATLVDLAGAERVVVGVGSGFTSRFAMGQKPVPWRACTSGRAASRPCCAARRSSGRAACSRCCTPRRARRPARSRCRGSSAPPARRASRSPGR